MAYLKVNNYPISTYLTHVTLNLQSKYMNYAKFELGNLGLESENSRMTAVK